MSKSTVVAGSIVEEIWNRRYDADLPMSREVKLAGFFRWIKCKACDLTSFEGLERLAVPLALGGGHVRFPGHELQDVASSWVVVGPHTNLRRGELFFGTGKNLFESSVSTLMTAYETIVLRKTR